MARSTRLFQRTGSPLIQGSSRLHRSFVPPLVAGFLAGAMLPPAFTWVTRVWAGDSVGGALDAALEYWAPRAPGLVLGAGIGAALGVTIGRAWGAFRAWIPAAAFALILGLAGAYAYAAYAT